MLNDRRRFPRKKIEFIYKLPIMIGSTRNTKVSLGFHFLPRAPPGIMSAAFELVTTERDVKSLMKVLA